MTRREQLISQMRRALYELQRPELEDYNTEIVFDIADTEFDFTMEELNEYIQE